MLQHRLSQQAYMLFFLLLSLVLALGPAMVWGHGPKDITLAYDTGSRTLRVTLTHTVSNPHKHYIQTVSITRNGELIATHEYTGQPDSSPFTYTYTIEAEPGDMIEATADCNYFGSKTGTLTLDK